MKKILIFILLFLFYLPLNAVYIKPEINKIYNNFILKIEKKYDIDKEINVLTILQKKLTQIKNNPKNKNKLKLQNILKQFLELNNKKILELKKQKILQNWADKKKKQKEEQNFLVNPFIKSLLDKQDFTKYFKYKSYNYENIILQDGVWYAYIFKNYLVFPENAYITKKDLDYNGIDLNKDLVFVSKENRIGIVKNPQKIRLINDNIIKNISNKYNFLKELKRDISLSKGKNYDKDFIKLRNFIQTNTKNLNKEQKIEFIYDYILKNFSYAKEIDFNNYKLFSGIEIFKNKIGVCEAYARFMFYALSFAGIDDVGLIKGYVIDARDFPQVGHAWIKVGNKYYDPTFDDPLGLEKTKNKKEYKYFALNKDLFYINRYEKNNLPEYIKKLSLEKRKEIILNNLIKIYPKYKSSNLLLIKPLQFREKYNIGLKEKITFNNFSKILPLYKLEDYSFVQNGKRIYIKKFKYYDLENYYLKHKNFETLLEQLNYNLDNYYYFLFNGKRILAYDIEF